MSPPPPTVFVVDDDEVLLYLLSRILRSAGHPVEAFDRPQALLGRLSERDRGCVILDLQMPGLTGLELLDQLRSQGVALPMIFVSGQSDVAAAVLAMKRGAIDFLCKPVDPDELCRIVAKALDRDRELVAERTARAKARQSWLALTPRQQSVCRMSARGLLNKQIAAELALVESTVQAQRARALQKLGVATIAELLHLLAEVDQPS
jgi:FixJ family two-component response regulator